MTAGGDDTQRAIGRLEGKLDSLIKSVEQMAEQSSTARGKIYERVERISADTADVDRRLGELEKTVKVMDPMVQDLARLKERGLGVLALLGFIWLFVGGLILQGIGWLWSALLRSMGGGP